MLMLLSHCLCVVGGWVGINSSKGPKVDASNTCQICCRQVRHDAFSIIYPVDRWIVIFVSFFSSMSAY